MTPALLREVGEALDGRLARRLARNTSAPDERGCLLWTASKDTAGYGSLRWNGKLSRASRLAWLARRGPIPTGLHVLHKCDVRSCVNVDHMFLGTHRDNMADCKAKGRMRRLKGETNPAAKLTEDVVRAIRFDARPQREIAAHYGVDPATVSDIKCGRTWISSFDKNLVAPPPPRVGLTGENNPGAVLTWAIVRLIRSSNMSGRALAKQIGISHRTVNDVRRGRAWVGDGPPDAPRLTQ